LQGKKGEYGRDNEQRHYNRDHPGAEVYNIIAGKNHERGKDISGTAWQGMAGPGVARQDKTRNLNT
jgi:hypothetical protein